LLTSVTGQDFQLFQFVDGIRLTRREINVVDFDLDFCVGDTFKDVERSLFNRKMPLEMKAKSFP